MNSRLFIYAFVIATFFACGQKEKKADTTSNASEKTNTSTETEEEKEINKDVIKVLTIDDKIVSIKATFSKVEKLVPALDKKLVKEDVGGGFTELEGYFNPDIPVKVKNSEMGEHGSMITTYYFKDNKLFFVFEQEFSEASMRGPFTNKEKRYYMYDGELIRVLEKEKTVKSGEIDMSKVQNIDITDQWKSKADVVTNLKKAARDVCERIGKVKTIRLDNGRWISTDDANSGVEIKDGKFIMFYKSGDKIINTVHSYGLTEKDGIEYLNLLDDSGEESVYGLLEYSEESMVLSYLNRGSTLTYRKEK
ncbi:hypothetical protein [Kordia sp.]|uniref:hypothetical protein n=1 Tax=Kordia sp. TaxID=1965332 RepID=UPI003D6BA451